MAIITNENLEVSKSILITYYINNTIELIKNGDEDNAISNLEMIKLDMNGTIEDIQEAFNMIGLELDQEDENDE